MLARKPEETTEDLPTCQLDAFSSPRPYWHSCPFPPSRRECSRRHPLIPRLSAAAPKPTTTGAATHPVAAKLNLNTATVAELDKAPQIGPTRSKAIVEARAKEKFKNWDDFVARKVVPADAAAAMKDVVSF